VLGGGEAAAMGGLVSAPLPLSLLPIQCIFFLSFSSFAANLDRSNHKFLTHMTGFLVNDDGCLRPHLMEDG
jgi:hypothetical protein